jgi:acyl dehydratase
MPTSPAEPAGPPAAEATYRVDPEAIVRYAGASGDFTSFHYDVVRARSMGYDTLFAMGMLAAGHLGTLAASVAEAPVRSISFRFLSRSWVGRDVVCRAWRAEQTDGEVGLHLRAVDDTGVAIVTGYALISAPAGTRTSA